MNRLSHVLPIGWMKVAELGRSVLPDDVMSGDTPSKRRMPLKCDDCKTTRAKLTGKRLGIAHKAREGITRMKINQKVSF